MNRRTAIASAVLTFVLSGCVAVEQQLRPEQPLSFILESTPSQAEVYVDKAKGSAPRERLGTTPLRLNLGLAEQREHLLLGITRHKAWHVLSDELQFTPAETEHRLCIRSEKLRLVKQGYEPETAELVLETDTRLSSLQPTVNKMVFFREPTSRQHEVTVRLESVPTGAAIHEMEKDGSMASSVVGRTPYTVKLGIAERLTENGTHNCWWIWSRNKIFKGFRVNCYLVKDGYEPEKLVNREIGALTRNMDWDMPKLVSFKLLRPNRPTKNAKLYLDSLPSEASVYTLQEDGTIGRKLGETPLECEVGFAQESYEKGHSGKYFHKAWRVWGPDGFIRWLSDDSDGRDVGRVFLSCALYKEGFAVEQVVHEVFSICWNEPPNDRTLTVPLITPELALMREQARLQRELLREKTDVQRAMAEQERKWAAEVRRRQSEVVVKQDPHFGRETEDAMDAVGSVLRPFSKLGPAETEQRIQALKGLGALMDILK